jgi:hypothetical protein
MAIFQRGKENNTKKKPKGEKINSCRARRQNAVHSLKKIWPFVAIGLACR